MRSIAHLETQLIMATKQKLIYGFEHIKNKDMILIKLKESTSEKTREKLRLHIKDNYKDVIFITFTPYDKSLYIKYTY